VYHALILSPGGVEEFAAGDTNGQEGGDVTGDAVTRDHHGGSARRGARRGQAGSKQAVP